MNKYKRLFGDTLIFAIGNIGSKFILFFLVPVYTNYMTTSQYGTADLIFTFAQLLMPFTSIVIYDAVLRFGLSSDTKKENVLFNSLVVIVIGIIILLILTPVISCYEAIAEWKWYLSIYIIVSTLNLTFMNYLKVKGKNRIYAIVSIIQTAITALLNIVLLVFMHLNIKGYLLANIVGITISVIIAAVLGNVFIDLKKSRVDKKLFKEMVCYSLPLILNNISWWVVQSSDKMMVQIMLNVSALGLYTVAAKIPALINVMINVFSQAWGISSVREIESTNDCQFYSRVLEIYTFLGFGFSIFLVSIVKFLMPFYVGKTFIQSWKYVPILLAAAAFAAIAYYYGSLYGALKKSVNNMITTLIAAIVNIIINFIFIKLYGVYGAAIGTLAAYIVMAHSRMLDVGRFIKIRISKKIYIMNCLLVISQAILVSLDIQVILVSILVIVLYIINNRRLINEIKTKILCYIRFSIKNKK